MRIELFVGARTDLLPLLLLADDSLVQVEKYMSLGDVLVAREGQVIVGHVQLIESGEDRVPEIKSLAVTEARQREGIGGQLVEEAIRLCRQRGLARLIVATATVDISNLRFYQRHGFRMYRIVQDAFSESKGYRHQAVDGMVLRDQVFLEFTCEPISSSSHGSMAESKGSMDRSHDIRPATPEDQACLLAIWLASVRATHYFLTEAEIRALMPATSAYLASPGHALWVLCEVSLPIGFMGLDGSSIESLFIAPDRIRRGGGRALVEHARTISRGRLRVDVNEQNFAALFFYRALDFVVVGQSAVDDQGRPYPLMHMIERQIQ